MFVAVYQSALKLLYVEELLQRTKAVFSQHYTPKQYDYAAFEGAFKRELEKAETRDFAPRPVKQAQGNLVQRKVGTRILLSRKAAATGCPAHLTCFKASQPAGRKIACCSCTAFCHEPHSGHFMSYRENVFQSSHDLAI